MPVDWKEIRKDFPVTRKWLYLDHASAGPLPRPVYEEGVACLKEYHCLSDLSFDRWVRRREEVRGEVARLIGARPDEIGFTHSTSEGMNIICDHLQSAKEVVAGELEFPSSTVPWLYRDFPVRWVKAQSGILPVQEYQKVMGRSPGVLLSSYVQFINGFRQDLKALGSIKKNHRFVVNATQGLGVFPLNVRTCLIDALATNSYKWFLGGYGGGFVYISRELLARGKPAYVGWRSVRTKVPYGNRDFVLRKDAGRCEYGCPNFINIFMMGRVIEYQRQIGCENIRGRILSLCDDLIQGLQQLGLTIASPLEKKYRSGIVVFAHSDPIPLARRLLQRRVFVNPRGAGIRVAPHFYNNSQDIQKFLKILKTEL